MQRNYNYIYSRLVENENDIVGHIAYSLYKTQKIQHIQVLKSKQNQDPTDADLVPYNDFSSSQSSLDSYKLKAQIILEAFIKAALEETIKEIQADTVQNQKELLKDVVKPLTPTFLSGVWQNVVASFAVIAIFGIIIILLQARDQGVEDVIENTFDVEINKKQPTGPTGRLDSTTVKPYK